MLCRCKPWLVPSRVLSSITLLETIRGDPGQTAAYYASRYFGGRTNEAKVTSVLWSELKRFGMVELQRREGPSESPRWYAVRFQPRRAQAHRHRPEDEDLSLLQSEEQQQGNFSSDGDDFASVVSSGSSTAETNVAASSVEELSSLIMSLIRAFPERDMPFYIQQLTSEGDRRAAPATFKALRGDGKITRTQKGGSAFVWSVSNGSGSTTTTIGGGLDA